MGPLSLILALAFSLLIAVIAIANNEVVSVNYLFGRTQVSLIVLILGSAIAGALAMGLFALFRGVRTAFRFRETRRRQEELQKRIGVLEEEKALLEAELIRRKAQEAGAPEPVEPPGEAGAPAPEEEPAGPETPPEEQAGQ